MGDFNDYPSNESLEKVVQENLFNLMQQNYRLDLIIGKGNWNWLDQIMLQEF